ncbi:unnamed protein product [Clonostachys rosea]|uniref:Protein kinase domain-containing protein n=1 Tax=Bionectria ochroleuca TaxID=29856 RepID=A0ABY6UMF5_BIOOC|nr:unnamed protein product [Clonostachys rosea]
MSGNSEPHRIWHDPVIEIYGNLITPGVRCAAQAYDLANRRWYQLQVDSVIAEENWDWMSSIVAKHVREYHQTHQESPPWNTIKTTKSGSPVAFETQPYHLVERPITKKLYYGDKPSDKLPLGSFEDIKEKHYLSRAADHCLWNNEKCVFKRIEFNVDIPSFEREIRTREALSEHIDGDDYSMRQTKLLERFKVVLILTVITDGSGPRQYGNVFGFIMPFLGNSLEMLEEGSPDSHLPLEEEQVRGLVGGVLEMSWCGVVHGDIKFWNVVLGQPPYHNKDSGKSELLLIDLGDVAPEYPGDTIALGIVIDWCLENSDGLRSDPAIATRMKKVSDLLKSEKITEAFSLLNAP